MKNIFIINGHEKYGSSTGRLNRTMSSTIETLLEKNHHVKTTILQNGYNIEAEQQHYLWADVVIYQTPIFWFSVPGLLKTYWDKVLTYGMHYSGADRYGTGGLLTEKKYMFSVTWNAPETAFHDQSQFFEGKDLEDALAHLHRIHKFIGMSPLKSFACYDVIKNPQVQKYTSDLENHLKQVLESPF